MLLVVADTQQEDFQRLSNREIRLVEIQLNWFAIEARILVVGGYRWRFQGISVGML